MLAANALKIMKYKFFVYCPYNEKLINKIIDAASDTGAGILGNYSHNAYIVKGLGNWKSEIGSHPTIGKVGQITRIEEARIEMDCPAKLAKQVEKAIRKVHPYEEPDIFFVKIEEIS